MQRIIKCLRSEIEEEFSPVLKIAGNLSSSADPQNIDVFLFHGGLSALNDLLSRDLPTKNLKELLWCLSNITAGTEEQISAVLNEQECMERVFKIMDSEIKEVAREAIYVVTNLVTTTSNPANNLSLVSHNEF